MQKMLVIIICWCWCMLATAQPNIVQAEYYIDNDPGFGSATNIPVTAGINIANVTFPVALAAVPQGMHAVFVRSKNATGNWSLTNSLFFYRQSTTGAAVNIIKAEYYFDNDPGFGYATNIALTPGANLQNINFVASLNSLGAGIHILFIRSMDANGNWSVTNQLVYYKNVPTPSTTNITLAEYYFDNDPGFGYATSIPITAGPNLQNINFTAGINTLTVGIHILFVRSMDANGNWSVTNQLVYYKKDPLAAAPNITRVEYYFDNDPGFGLATVVPVTAAPDQQNISFLPGIQSLAVGLHILFLRSCDANGNWSVTNQLVCYKPAPAPGGITAIEYYYDSEPGFGNGVPVAINETTDLADYLAPVNITGLSAGDHNLFLRSRSSNGWSVTNMYAFNLAASSPTPFININSVTNTINCAYDQFRISFHSTGNYLPNNIFTVQLSDAAGGFATPINIGKVTAQLSSEVSCRLPAHLAYGAAYKVRVISSNTSVTGIASAASITIHDRPELGNDTTVFIVCANETLDLLPLFNTNGLVSNWSIATPTKAAAGNYQLIATSTYGCRDTASTIVKQNVSFWRGTISNNWHLAGNWSNGKVPDAKTHVIITGTTLNACEISGADGVAASVQVKAAGIIRLINNRKLFVNANCNPLPTGL